MITTILSDFSRVLLLPQDENYLDSLNGLNRDMIAKYGETYDFFRYFKMNDELLELYKKLKARYPIYIFTSEDIQNRKEVREIIDPIVSGIYSAKDLNISRKEPMAYKFVADKLGQKPEEVLYIDDLEENVERAKEAGLQALRYTTFEEFERSIQKFL